jgi:uncharacterized membrane protein
VLGCPVYLVLWMFVVYSFLGVVVEGLFFLVRERVVESRTGLLYLPLRPLYGFGGLGFALLRPLAHRPVLVFVLGALVATVVEYVASLLMEHAFAAVSWDYRDHRFNLGGRVCLGYSVCWGLLALVALYLIDQPLRDVLRALPHGVGETTLTVVLVLTALSAVLTLAALDRTRRRVLVLEAPGNGPGGAVRRADRLVQRLAPDPVLINSFPRMTLVTELARLTGQQRAWIRLPAPLASGSSPTTDT